MMRVLLKSRKKANSKYDIVDYNCKVYFNEKPEDLVVCRHISLQYCIDSMNENTGKVPLKECYSTPEGIQQHFPYELDQQFDNLINNPPPVHASLPVTSSGRYYLSSFTEWKKRS